MRSQAALLLVLVTVSFGCEGAAGLRGRNAKTADNAEDKGFADYAAAHGIETLAGGGGGTAEVTADGLRLERLDPKSPVTLDGVLTEWPAPAKAAVVTGTTRGELKVGLEYDDAKLYVGAQVRDEDFRVGHDHVAMVLAIPRPGGSYAAYELDFFAGKPGETAGSVRAGQGAGKRVLGNAKIVEAPEDGGYSFEAVVPWSALPEARLTMVGVHGVAAYIDGQGVVATGPGDARHPREMPWIPSEPEISMIEQLLEPKGLAKRAPDAEIIADLTGDGHRERIAVWEHYLTICGASYLGGTGFFYRDLVGEVVKLEARDVTGRGKADVIVRRRQSVGDGTREYVEVLSAMSRSTQPVLTFAHEISVRQSDRHVDNSVHMARGSIQVDIEPATHWDAASYSEPVSTDVEPILLPWGPVRSQVFRFDGQRFSRAREVTQLTQPTHAIAAGAADAPAARPAEPPTPEVGRDRNLSAQVFEQYRKDRGADRAPKVDLEVQVAGDPRPERVVLVGRDIVVFGPGFKGGTGYAVLTLEPFASPSDVESLSARDLTGDGAADLIVRGVRHIRSDRGTIEQSVMLVYQVKDESIQRIFGIETALAQHGKRVQGLVQLVPAENGKTFDVLAAPGRATGWSEKTYPWSRQASKRALQDGPGGDIEPLLLPWGGVPSVRYSWNGSKFEEQ